MKLYELAEEFIALQSQIDNEELPDIEEELKDVEMAFKDKVENCAKMILTLKAEQGAVQNEINRLRRRKTTLKNGENNLKKYVQNQMEATDITSIRTELFKVNIQKSPMSICIVDENVIPEEFVRFDPRILKDKIIHIIKTTGEIPEGIEPITNKTHLRIY